MALTVETVPYSVGDGVYDGVFVRDAAASDVALVLMAPDWMGVSDGAVAMARTIAEMGASVFVADLYGRGRRPSSVQEAISLSGPLKADPTEVRRRIGAALTAMRAAAPASHAPQAAIGFCFGGMNVLELARSGADLALFVSIHGDLTSGLPATPGAIRGTVIVLHGAADPISPKSQRDAFEAEMELAGVTWFATTFGQAVHSFTNPDAAVPGVALYDRFAADWSLFIVERALRQMKR